MTLGVALRLSLAAIAALWLIKLLELALAIDLTSYGIYPKRVDALLGILLAPLIHGSFAHLIANTLPIGFLLTILWLGYPRAAIPALAIIWLLSGTLVWWVGRASYHFGASGLSHGLFFFLVVAGLLRRDHRSLVLLMLAFFMYGGMLFSIFPSAPGISWEMHIGGGFAGVAAAFMLRRLDSAPQQRRYSWQEPGKEDDVEDVIGDQWRMNGDSEGNNTHVDGDDSRYGSRYDSRNNSKEGP